MPDDLIYPVNPDRTLPWNELPDLPIDPSLYRDVEIYEQLGNAKEALALLAGRNIAIPNPAMLINSITLQEAKVSSAIENVFTTDAGVSQQADWKKWFLYMLRAVEWTSSLTLRKVNDILAGKEEILQAVREHTDIRRPEDLVEAIFTQPYTKVNHLVEQGMYAENTARSYLNELVGLQVLEKRELKGRHYYVNSELVEILSY